jgi:glyoxylase I family protein
MRVHHIAVQVSDLDRAEAFYRGVLGLAVERRWQHADGTPRSIWMSLGDAFLAIEQIGASGAGSFSCVALAIDVGERDAWRERLERAGFAIERETDYTIYTRDPDGASIGLSHWPQARR